MERRIHNRKYLEPWRKELRNEGTSAEAFLWKFLQHRKLEGRKFRRQHSILNYIIDFYCPEERLIVELDGMGHFTEEGMERDRKRTEVLMGLGFRVIRFENKRVFGELEKVLGEIRGCFKSNG